MLGVCTHRGTETSQATSQPAAGWAGGSRMRLCSHTTSKPTATGPGVLCERSHGTAGKAKRTLRAPCRRAACLGRRRRRVDQSSGPSESRRGHPQHAVGEPRSPRECRDDARWLVCFVGVESTSADKYEPNRLPNEFYAFPMMFIQLRGVTHSRHASLGKGGRHLPSFVSDQCTCQSFTAWACCSS